MNLLLLADQKIEGRLWRQGEYVLDVNFIQGCTLIRRGLAICASPNRPIEPKPRKRGRGPDRKPRNVAGYLRRSILSAPQPSS